MTGDLATTIAERKISVEQVLKIVYQPQSVFRVRAVTRCSAAIAGHAEAVLSVAFSTTGKIWRAGAAIRRFVCGTWTRRRLNSRSRGTRIGCCASRGARITSSWRAVAWTVRFAFVGSDHWRGAEATAQGTQEARHRARVGTGARGVSRREVLLGERGRIGARVGRRETRVPVHHARHESHRLRQMGRRGVDLHGVSGHDDLRVGRHGRESRASTQRPRALGEFVGPLHRVCWRTGPSFITPGKSLRAPRRPRRRRCRDTRLRPVVNPSA